MTLQLHRPDGKGGLEPRPPVEGDWREDLRSPRWGKALSHGRLPELGNPEMRPTSVVMSVLFWAGLAFLTFLIVWIGYGIGFWQFGG
jgi:hypothetical protein